MKVQLHKRPKCSRRRETSDNLHNMKVKDEWPASTSVSTASFAELAGNAAKRQSKWQHMCLQHMCVSISPEHNRCLDTSNVQIQLQPHSTCRTQGGSEEAGAEKALFVAQYFLFRAGVSGWSLVGCRGWAIPYHRRSPGLPLCTRVLYEIATLARRWRSILQHCPEHQDALTAARCFRLPSCYSQRKRSSVRMWDRR